MAELWNNFRRSWTTCSSKPRSHLSRLFKGTVGCQIFKSKFIHLASQHRGASWKLDGTTSTFAGRVDKSQTWSQRCPTIVSGILWSDRAAVSRPSAWQEPLHCKQIWWSHFKSWGTTRRFSFPGVSARMDPIASYSMFFCWSDFRRDAYCRCSCPELRFWFLLATTHLSVLVCIHFWVSLN